MLFPIRTDYRMTRRPLVNYLLIAANVLLFLVTRQGGVGGVAYAAHTSGYVFGIAVSAGLLALRLLPRDPLDLLNLFRAWRRRRAYRRTVAGGYDPFSRTASAVGPGAGHGATRRVAMQSVGSATPQTPQAQAMRVRRRIAEAIRNHDLSAAADHYVSLVGLDDQAVLAQPRQLDVANQLMAEQRHADAADAYERFLRHYAAYEHTGDIFLMLGLLYGRYLQQYPRAEECLSQAAETLRDRRKADMARRELQIVRRRLES